VWCGQVNGVSLISVAHYQAVAAIKSAGHDMTLVVVKATASPSDEPVCCSDLFFGCHFWFRNNGDTSNEQLD